MSAEITGLVVAALWGVAKVLTAGEVWESTGRSQISRQTGSFLFGVTWGVLPLLLTATGVMPFDLPVLALLSFVMFTGAGGAGWVILGLERDRSTADHDTEGGDSGRLMRRLGITLVLMLIPPVLLLSGADWTVFAFVSTVVFAVAAGILSESYSRNFSIALIPRPEEEGRPLVRDRVRVREPNGTNNPAGRERAQHGLHRGHPGTTDIRWREYLHLQPAGYELRDRRRRHGLRDEHYGAAGSLSSSPEAIFPACSKATGSINSAVSLAV